MVRAVVSGNLLVGAVAWGIFAVVAFFSQLQAVGKPEEGVWFYIVLAITGGIACYVLWKWSRDELQWEYASTAKRWLCFIVTPWGALLTFSVGIAIVATIWLVRFIFFSGEILRR